METIKKLFTLVIGFPIGCALFAVIVLCASLLWPIYGIVYLYNYIISSIAKKTVVDEMTQGIEEFIFACYGFAALFLIMPLSVIDDEEQIFS